jgi:hypothetical protein
MQLKVMQYNILNGFFSNDEPFRHELERQAAAVDVVKREDPDVLILCEASFGFPSRFGVVQDYQKIFGYPYCYLGRHGERSGTALLSKFEGDFQDFGMFHRAFSRTSLKIRNRKIVFDIVHPHPSLEDWEKERLVRAAIRDRGDCYVLAGDFNACSPQDKYSRTKLIDGFARFTGHAEAAVDNLLG